MSLEEHVRGPELGTDEQFEALLDFIKENRSFDFTGYKKPSLRRRIAKRMEAVGAADFASYLERLRDSETEFAELFDTILINVTGFFRDPQAWEDVGAEVIPSLVGARAADEPIRVWSAGCATGEEAFTLAMLVAEALGEENFRERVKIYATDVDESALRDARHGLYTRAQIE